MAEVISERIGPTLLLFGVGELIAIVVGLSLGARAGWRRGKAADFLGTGASLVLYSMPYFWLGMILLIIFAATLHWFPTNGMTTPGADYANPIDQVARRLLAPGPAGGHGRPGVDRPVLADDALVGHRGPRPRTT